VKRRRTRVVASRVLEAENLACRRGERLVFAGVSFAVPRGGALVLLGPNGSGKSSLLRLLAGLTPVESGRVLWDGAPVRDDAAGHRARIRFVGHQDAVKPALTVSENLAFWAGVQSADEGAVGAALALLGLDRLSDWPSRFLSAGQRRRLALARLLLAPAPVWLLDEPTTGLDRDSIASFEAALAAHRAAGGLVVASTHVPLDLSDARMLTLGARVARDPTD
jgi:heme exporter protein A